MKPGTDEAAHPAPDMSAAGEHCKRMTEREPHAIERSHMHRRCPHCAGPASYRSGLIFSCEQCGLFELHARPDKTEHCHKCGYDLRGAPSLQCPGCGRDLTLGQLDRLRLLIPERIADRVGLLQWLFRRTQPALPPPPSPVATLAASEVDDALARSLLPQLPLASELNSLLTLAPYSPAESLVRIYTVLIHLDGKPMSDRAALLLLPDVETCRELYLGLRRLGHAWPEALSRVLPHTKSFIMRW
jgi:hypothetical protein